MKQSQLIAAATLLIGAMPVGIDFKIKQPKPLDYHCISCGKKIPPGKPNRKCKTCRSVDD